MLNTDRLSRNERFGVSCCTVAYGDSSYNLRVRLDGSGAEQLNHIPPITSTKLAPFCHSSSSHNQLKKSSMLPISFRCLYIHLEALNTVDHVMDVPLITYVPRPLDTSCLPFGIESICRHLS